MSLYLSLSDEELYILGSLSHKAMTVNQLHEYQYLGPDFIWAKFEADALYRQLHFLQRNSLITWKRESGEITRIYSITEKGVRLCEITSLQQQTGQRCKWIFHSS